MFHSRDLWMSQISKNPHFDQAYDQASQQLSKYDGIAVDDDMSGNDTIG